MVLVHHAAALAALSLGLASGAGAQSLGSGGYCDTGFLRADTDENGLITEDESRAAAEAIFERIDSDDDGEISRAEFSDCYGRLAMRQSASVSDRSVDNMAEADLDGDGVVSRAEFMEAAQSAREEPEETSGESMTARDRTPPGEEAIAGGDGQPELSAPAGGTGTNVDRFVDAPLAGAGGGEEMDREELAARAARTFNSLDRNRDGFLTEDEWSQASAMRNDITQQLDRLFGQIDEDESGGLSEKEFLADSRARFEQALADEASEGDDGVPVLVYYSHQFGL